MTSLERWRLVLGRYSDQRLSAAGMTPLDRLGARQDAALEYLYGREYSGRGLREGERSGSLDPSQLRLVDWLTNVRELFPTEVCEVIEQHALERYGMTELLTDPRTLERMQPNQQLLRALLTLKGRMQGEVLQMARQIIRQVVEEIRRQLEQEVRQVLSGRLNRFRHSPMAALQNFDAAGTIRKNLRHYDPEEQRLVIEQLLFFDRNSRRLPWDIIMCVDQSGSMTDSVIHSAIMAGILCGLPAFRVKLVVFDTSIVDLSGHVDDPVEVLMRVQLGGGTDIAQAMRYCAQLVENPHRTVVVLVSDFYEGGSPAELLRVVGALHEARVTLLGLASLDGTGHADFDRATAERLVAQGMQIAALTPKALAEWLVGVIS